MDKFQGFILKNLLLKMDREEVFSNSSGNRSSMNICTHLSNTKKYYQAFNKYALGILFQRGKPFL